VYPSKKKKKGKEKNLNRGLVCSGIRAPPVGSCRREGNVEEARSKKELEKELQPQALASQFQYPINTCSTPLLPTNPQQSEFGPFVSSLAPAVPTPSLPATTPLSTYPLLASLPACIAVFEFLG